jgi:hypothetical protein
LPGFSALDIEKQRISVMGVKSLGGDKTFQATAADIGISSEEIHEARKMRDAEEREPGIIRTGRCLYRRRHSILSVENRFWVPLVADPRTY